MPENRLRVLVRWRFSAAYFQVSQEEQGKLFAEAGQIRERWKAAGARLVGDWTGGAVDGFRHYDLWEVPDLDMAVQLGSDWFRAETRKYIDIEFHMGSASAPDPS